MGLPAPGVLPAHGHTAGLRRELSRGPRTSPPSIPLGGSICSPHLGLRGAKSSARWTQLASCPTTLPSQDPRKAPQSQGLPAGESSQGLRGQGADDQVQEPTPGRVPSRPRVLILPGGANTVTKSPLPGRKRMCGDIL